MTSTPISLRWAKAVNVTITADAGNESRIRIHFEDGTPYVDVEPGAVGQFTAGALVMVHFLSEGLLQGFTLATEEA